LYASAALIRNLNHRDLTRSAIKHLKRPLLAEFYASWCGHCQHLAPAIRKLSILFEDKVDFGAVNCERKESLCRQQQIEGYPTLRLFLPDGSTDQYNGPLEPNPIEAWLRDGMDTSLRTFTNL